MKSALPKVLHQVAGRPMLEHVLLALSGAGLSQACLVLSEENASFEPLLRKFTMINVCIQRQPRGTGDAVASSAYAFSHASVPSYADGRLARGYPLQSDYLLICCGDTPAIQAGVLRDFVAHCLAANAQMGVLGMRPDNPTGYGRLVVDSRGQLQAIVEEKDADATTRAVTLVNSGVAFARVDALFRLLDQVRPNNRQNEYYLTDCFALSQAEGRPAVVYEAQDWRDYLGVNDRSQLAQVEALLVRRKISQLMASGVSFSLPDTCYIEPGVEIGQDTCVGPGAYVCRETSVGRTCTLGAHTYLDRVSLGEGVSVGPGSVLIDCEIAQGEVLPPLTRITGRS